MFAQSTLEHHMQGVDKSFGIRRASFDTATPSVLKAGGSVPADAASQNRRSRKGD